LARDCVRILGSKKLTMERAHFSTENAALKLAKALIESHEENLALKKEVRPLQNLRSLIHKLSDGDSKSESKLRRFLAEIIR